MIDDAGNYSLDFSFELTRKDGVIQGVDRETDGTEILRSSGEWDAEVYVQGSSDWGFSWANRRGGLDRELPVVGRCHNLTPGR